MSQDLYMYIAKSMDIYTHTCISVHINIHRCMYVHTYVYMSICIQNVWFGWVSVLVISWVGLI